MIQGIYITESNIKIADNIYMIRLIGDTTALTAPGQFVNIKIEGSYLRRPISVCNWDENGMTLIYKIVGTGTKKMSEAEAGTKFDLLTGLGNGYDMNLSGDRPMLIGGGVGIPPLYGLCIRLAAAGKKPVVILGFNKKSESYFIKEFKETGAEVITATADGSLGIKGFVTDAMPIAGDCSYIYTCGPMPMLKAVYFATETDGQFSFEERMGCGFGACMGCSCKTLYGSKRICVDGPVLRKEEIIWQI